MLGGQWKIPCLVVNGRSHAWWAIEDPMLGGQWKIPCLVGNGRSHAWWPLECSMLGGPWNVKEKTPFHLFHFPPTTFTYALNFFPLTPWFYFTMVLSRYSRLSFLFFDL
jgi:hypothetical protein